MLSDITIGTNWFTSAYILCYLSYKDGVKLKTGYAKQL